MHCEQVRKLLGRFHDSELDAPTRAAVELHLGDCAACAAELAGIAELSAVARALEDLEPPGGLWEQIDRRLSDARPRRFAAARRLLHRWQTAAVAAVVFVTVATGWWVYRVKQPDSDPSLDELLVTHRGEQIGLQEAVRRVDFRVLASAQLPNGYCLENCCLCRDGCCDVLQCCFVRGKDKVLLVQGGPDSAMQFGDRPAVQTQVNGKPARIVQCRGGSLAASWQTRGTSLSLIGPHDVTELVQLVTFVDDHLEKGKTN
jgi:hypothetical protein